MISRSFPRVTTAQSAALNVQLALRRLGTGLLAITLVAAAVGHVHAQGAMPAAGGASAVAPSPVSLSKPIVTAHSGAFHGKKVDYEAIVEPITTTDLAGHPAARLGAISYVARDTGDAASRPVIFIFNGGPGSASFLLHIGAMGPKRLSIPDDVRADPSAYKLVDNSYALLDVADLVFFNPTSTGFSRTLDGVTERSQDSVVADARQLVELVRVWSTSHGRLASPKFLVGESYGTVRIPEAASQLQKAGLPLDGVFMLSEGTNILEYAQRPGNAISFAVSLPSLSAIAWSHDRAARNGRSFDAFFTDAQEFARTQYLPVLMIGDRAPLAQREAIARKLEEFTGISADYYLAHHLKITKQEYRRALFPGQILGEHDARYIGPIDKGDPFEVVPQAYSKAFHAYLVADLRAGDVGTYVDMTPPINFNDWDWGPNRSPFGNWNYTQLLTDVLRVNPKFRIALGNGYYDTQTTIGAMDYLVDQAGWSRDRVSTAYYQGGHMAYTVEASLRQFSQAIRDLVTHAN